MKEYIYIEEGFSTNRSITDFFKKCLFERTIL